MGALDMVWPRSAALDPDGVLRLGGVRVTDLVAEHGTPAFFLDEADTRERMARWRSSFDGAFGPGRSTVTYAGKAFLCRAVARWAADAGLGLDVCTGGELAVAQAADIPMDKVLLHGNNKSVSELQRAAKAGVGRIVVDSFDEIDRLAELGLEVSVLLRVTPGVEAHTHEFVQTGQEDQKFGFSLASGMAAEATRRIAAVPALTLTGIHAHIGSQIFDVAAFRLAAHRMVAFLAEQGLDLPELDLGGGTGIAYTSADAPMPVEEFASRLAEVVSNECAAAGVAMPHVIVEPGRAIIGPGTVTVYEVGTVKELTGLRTYVSVDGGMSDNIRTSLYGATYAPRLASRASGAPDHLVTLVGKHCENGDVVAHDVPLPADLHPGDLVAVPASGAYHRSMASNYNHVPRPPVVAVVDGTSRVLVRRETEDDLLSLEVGHV
jgi:diaminopimelate decarboxylase